ncbi:DNA polymerase III subunit epsilon [Temperatibacter marinus]|uniref:DNA polymerase III subunit epsilon n=1 Tax=Temperatibacter marinus TaxID=1456591 RepID=A0AA52EF60_9PROT|nr:DNA polymerase III subunit epsilon [Temperatibacter marinus]WND03661.1 DNA polymerase III subunit epsilon [Temperatibacter marinus]
MNSIREIVFDTETTGFDPFSGDRVIEIGCVVLINKIVQTGEENQFHRYCNPRRDVPESAVKVHGLTAEMLADKPYFEDVMDEFLDFVGDDILVAHNAEFDKKFINWELENAGRKPIPAAQFKDTLAIARGKYPGAQNSLDALCRRFGIENGHRTLHGALLDSEILADVYVELEGGRQTGLELTVEKKKAFVQTEKKKREPRSFPLTDAELEAHKDYIMALKDPLWGR